MPEQFRIVLFVLLLLIISCKSNESRLNCDLTHIEVNVEAKQYCPLDRYFKIKNIVLLETCDSSLMGNISKLQVKSNKFYFLSGKSLFIFKETGEFLWKISNEGRGPSEYSEITDFIVDEESNMIEVLDMVSKKVIVFDKDQFFYSFNITFRPMSFTKTDQGDYLFYCSSINNGLNHRFSLYSKSKNKIIQKILPINPVQDQFLRIIDKSNFVSLAKDTILCLYGFNDTIYKYSKNSGLSPYIYIDFGNKKVPETILNKPYSDVSQFLPIIWESGFASQIIGFYMSKRYTIFGFFQNRKVYNVLTDNSTNETIVFDKYTLNSFIDGFNFNTDYSNPLTIDEKKNIYFKIEPPKIRSYLDSIKRCNGYLKQTYLKYERIAQFDNPIILQLEEK